MWATVTRNAATSARRKFLLAGGAGLAAAVAMPQVSRAQTVSWKFQSAWSTREIQHEFAVDYARKVADMTGGRLRLNVLAAGSVVPPFQLAQASHTGILEGGFGMALSPLGKHRAHVLFGNPPPFGWDSHGFLGWFYHGGGEALYRELLNDVLKLNLTGFLSHPMLTQPLGWFRKEMTEPSAFKGLRYRTVGLAVDVFKQIGANVIMLPSGEIVATIERGLLDAAEIGDATSELSLGLPEAAKVYMLGSHHRQASACEVVFNKAAFDALPAEFRAILRHAAAASSSDQVGVTQARHSKDLAEIRRRGVNVVKTGEAVLRAELEAWDRLLAAWAKEPFFAKVLASQANWVKQTVPYLQANNLDSAALHTAYKHFFG